jgi:co-chaperonin GroES (HSP10)
MPSHDLNLSPADVPHFRPLPGHLLLKVLPPDLQTHRGLHLPENYAGDQERVSAIRKGEIVYVNIDNNKHHKVHLAWEEMDLLVVGKKVWYLGHGDEMDSEYVVVMHGQVVGVAE